jgi:hypothetical protein
LLNKTNMKYFFYFLICISLQSCFQCNDSYEIQKTSSNDVDLYLRGGFRSERITLEFEYYKEDDTCNLVIQNADFKFVNSDKIIKTNNIISPSFGESRDVYKELKDLPEEYRNLKLYVESQELIEPKLTEKEFTLKVDFEKKYEDLERFKLYVKTDFKDKYNRLSSQTDSFDINISNKCHFHFLLH